MIYKILTVIGLATFEIYAAIPAGFAFKLNPIAIFLYSVLGGLIGVFVAAYLGDIIKKWVSTFRKNKVEKIYKTKIMNTQELKEQLYKDKKKSLEIIKKLESNLK